MTAVQATDAEQKEDREIICGEVFADVTGELDELAQGDQCRIQLGTRYYYRVASLRPFSAAREAWS